jgi:SAM-dependent methyltransferase
MGDRGSSTANRWNASEYDDGHSFVFEYGDDVVDLLDPKAHERVLDVGCGTGQLSARIATTGAEVVGLDASEKMIARAREGQSNCAFVHADARSIPFERSFDAVFSNAALHWIPEQDEVLESVAETLVPGGRFVAELGATGNVAALVGAVRAEAATRGYDIEHPWYFPTIGEYASKIESHGLEPRYVRLFDRPTELEYGPEGLSRWLGMFGDSLLAPIPPDERETVVAAVEDRLRAEYYDDEAWVADYRRLRVVAVNPS